MPAYRAMRLLPRLLLAPLVTLVAAFSALTPGVARAQPAAPAASAPDVTLPVVQKNEGVAYPKQALDEGFRSPAQVALTVTIDAAGAVTEAVVETPAGHGFDEAAIAAAHKLEFTPAMRGGKPVAARIRFVYRFVPPPGVLSGRVVTLAGEHPIAGATVIARDAAGRETAATTGPDGMWRIPGAEAGTYHVTVSAPGMVSHEADQPVLAGEEVSATDCLAPPGRLHRRRPRRATSSRWRSTATSRLAK